MYACENCGGAKSKRVDISLSFLYVRLPKLRSLKIAINNDFPDLLLHEACGGLLTSCHLFFIFYFIFARYILSS